MKVFISYRRTDSEDLAGRINDRLCQVFGNPNIFFDVRSIAGGENFAEAIKENLSNADVVLVLIGSQWVNATDSKGNKRLDDPEDFVRREVELSLQRGEELKVIPVLLKDTPMPLAEELPPSLRRLTELQANKVHLDPYFDIDIESLVKNIRMPLAEELPPSLRRLTELQANKVHLDPYFDLDIKGLVKNIRKSKHNFSLVILIIAVLVLAIFGIGLFLLSQQNRGGQGASTTLTAEQTLEIVSIPATTVMPTATDTSYPTETSSPTPTNTSTYTATASATDNDTNASPTSMQISTIVPSLTSVLEVENNTLSGEATVGFPCDANIISSESQVLNVVRASAADSSPAVISVVPNESVIVLDVSRQNSRTFWYQIARSETETLGWIAPRYLVLSPLCPSQ